MHTNDDLIIDKPGYHITTFAKGEVGEISKIAEELNELQDARLQGVKIMELIEMSDMIGSIEAYLEKYHPGTTIADLCAMSNVTRRAFRNGHR